MGTPGRDDYFGHGRLNVYAALHAAEPCYADMNRDEELTVADFSEFQSLYSTGAYRADCNADTVLSIADFGCLQARFVAGCP